MLQPYVQSVIYDVLATGDLDGDGHPDVVASSWDNNIYAISLRDISSALDTEPPIIANVAISPNAPTISETVKVSASIDDELSGVIEASIFYSLDSGTTWTETTMAQMTSSMTYEGIIPAQAPNAKVQFYVEAMDAWGNTTRSPTQEHIETIPLWVYGVSSIIMVLLFVFFGGGVHPLKAPYHHP